MTVAATALPAQTATAVERAGPPTQLAVATATDLARATEPLVEAEASPDVAAPATPLPAVIAHLIATPTAFGAVVEDAAAVCLVAEGWLPYQVQKGDSLLALALASGSSLIELREGNCFGPVTGIIVGDTIAVPSLPEAPIEPAESLFPISDSAYQLAGCESADATIIEPRPLAELQGIFAIRGRALIPDGGGYRLSVKPAWSSDYHRFLDVERSVSNDVIALINTEIFGPGLQRLRLEIVDAKGELMENLRCDIPVVFRAP